MDSLGPISALLAALGFLVLVGFLVPILIRLRKSTDSLAAIMDSLNQHFEPMLEDAKGMTGNLVETSRHVTEASARLVKLMDAVSHMGAELGEAEEFVEDKVKKMLSALSIWLARGSEWTNRVLHWRSRLTGRA